MEKDLIKWEFLQECSPEEISFSECVFLRDFGPWKKDQYVCCISIELETSTIKEFDNGGLLLNSCEFTLQPK